MMHTDTIYNDQVDTCNLFYIYICTNDYASDPFAV